MRVIAGTAKKRRLKAPRGLALRPTCDRVKEALFNILADRVPGCDFLDLFAGTGNVGIEALSRGAGSAVFVEKEHKNTKIIVENLKNTGLLPSSRVMRREAREAVAHLGAEGLTFDLVFMDPPYRTGLAQETLERVAAGGILKGNATVIVETGQNEDMPRETAGLTLIRQERYGDTMLSFYQRT
ncbi:MAG: 16S rRNA (guanine(966)-N(2))-methyltransferase RsmD [Firmicutes bacterium]|nr:16S rRNA (guanine(966)-N(2))-methyltransferase RsmD [Bacillota bacterium]